VPGHYGIEGNERVDLLAKQASSLQVFSRKQTSNDSGVSCHVHVLQSHAEVHSLSDK